jgi:hypothetical protein
VRLSSISPGRSKALWQVPKLKLSAPMRRVQSFLF